MTTSLSVRHLRPTLLSCAHIINTQSHVPWLSMLLPRTLHSSIDAPSSAGALNRAFLCLPWMLHIYSSIDASSYAAAFNHAFLCFPRTLHTCSSIDVSNSAAALNHAFLCFLWASMSIAHVFRHERIRFCCRILLQIQHAALRPHPVSGQISNSIFFEQLGVVAASHAHLPAVIAVILCSAHKPAKHGTLRICT